MLGNWKFRAFLMFASGFILLFIIAPLAGLFLNTSPPQFSQAISDPSVTASIRLTLVSSLLAVISFGVLSVPLAYLLARKKFFLNNLINGIIDLPLVIPHSAAGIALLGVLSRGSFLGGAGESVGISFVGDQAGIVVAMAFVSLPFLINSARNGFAAVPERIEKVALNLGASPWKVFFTISLPLAKRHIITGFTMMWARGLSEFGAIVIIAYHPMVAPVLIWERFASFGLAYARPVAAIFVAICLAIFVAMRLLSRNKSYDRG